MEQKNATNHLNQQGASNTPEGDQLVNSQLTPNNNNYLTKSKYANSLSTLTVKKEMMHIKEQKNSTMLSL